MGIPRPLYGAKTWPAINHSKSAPYIDYPIVFGATVTTEPFFIEYDWTVAMDDPSLVTLYKWWGNGWVAVPASIANPEVMCTRGWHAVTTSADATVSITEHYNSA